MASEYDTKAVLLDLMKQGANKNCFECDVPSPQWCSLSYGTYLCLTCSGVHRSLGVHLSFVRSLTMDKWTPAQIKRMEAGGNAKCRQFFEAAPEYSKSMSMPEKYNTHFAAQYRDKLLAEAEGRSWTPSDTPAPSTTSSTLRKPRITTSRGASPGISSSDAGRSGSPLSPSSRVDSPSYNSPAHSPSVAPPISSTQKSANENYFGRLGAANESRREDLPPSQGGKYGGFGSQGAFNPNEAMSSRALPSLDDLRDDPVSAVSKGWGMFSAALGAVTKTVNDSVVQPTLERAVDPNLQSQLSQYVSRAGVVLGEGARTGSQLLSTGLQSGGQILKRETGYDVGDLGASYVDRVAGRGAGGGYAPVGTFESPSAGDGEEDFFGSQMGGGGASGSGSRGGYNSSGGSTPQFGGGGGGSYRDEEPAPAPAPVPTLSKEDTWAKLAPQSVSRGGSGRSSPAAPAARAKVPVKAAPAKKDDDWDDFGDDSKWD